MKVKKFEQGFDEGIDITASLDLSKAKRVLQAQVTTDAQSRDAMLNFTAVSPQAHPASPTPRGERAQNRKL
jgi:hypothetical protein